MAYPKLLFDNRFADATPAASVTAAGNYNVANVADLRPYTWWKGAAMPAYYTVDCGVAKAADFVLIYGHDMHTQGSTLEVRGSTDNFATSNVLVVSVTPASDDPFLVEFAATSYRYWRHKFTGANAPSIAIALTGAAFVMPKYLSSGFGPLDREVVSESNDNDNGHPLGTIIDFELYQQTLQFENVSWNWLRNSWLPAWRSNLRGSPFVFAWDSVNYPAELRLVRAGKKFTGPHQAGSIASLSFDIQGVAQ